LVAVGSLAAVQVGVVLRTVALVERLRDSVQARCVGPGGIVVWVPLVALPAGCRGRPSGRAIHGAETGAALLVAVGSLAAVQDGVVLRTVALIERFGDCVEACRVRPGGVVVWVPLVTLPAGCCGGSSGRAVHGTETSATLLVAIGGLAAVQDGVVLRTVTLIERLGDRVEACRVGPGGAIVWVPLVTLPTSCRGGSSGRTIQGTETSATLLVAIGSLAAVQHGVVLRTIALIERLGDRIEARCVRPGGVIVWVPLVTIPARHCGGSRGRTIHGAETSATLLVAVGSLAAVQVGVVHGAVTLVERKRQRVDARRVGPGSVIVWVPIVTLPATQGRGAGRRAVHGAQTRAALLVDVGGLAAV